MHPPPLRQRVDGLGGLRVVVVGGFCEFNDEVHTLIEAATQAIVDGQRRRGGGGSRQEGSRR